MRMRVPVGVFWIFLERGDPRGPPLPLVLLNLLAAAVLSASLARLSERAETAPVDDQVREIREALRAAYARVGPFEATWLVASPMRDQGPKWRELVDRAGMMQVNDPEWRVTTIGEAPASLRWQQRVRIVCDGGWRSRIETRSLDALGPREFVTEVELKLPSESVRSESMGTAVAHRFVPPDGLTLQARAARFIGEGNLRPLVASSPWHAARAVQEALDRQPPASIEVDTSHDRWVLRCSDFPLLLAVDRKTGELAWIVVRDEKESVWRFRYQDYTGPPMFPARWPGLVRVDLYPPGTDYRSVDGRALGDAGPDGVKTAGLLRTESARALDSTDEALFDPAALAERLELMDASGNVIGAPPKPNLAPPRSVLRSKTPVMFPDLSGNSAVTTWTATARWAGWLGAALIVGGAVAWWRRTRS